LIAGDVGVGLQILHTVSRSSVAFVVGRLDSASGVYPLNSSDPEEDWSQASLSWQVDRLRD